MVTKRKSVKFSDSEFNDKAFTIVELLIVVALLGILAWVLFLVLKPEHFRDTSRDSARLSNISKIAGAAEVYASLEGGYPETQDVLEDAPVYIATWPDDAPASGDLYAYSYDSTDDSFTVSTSQSDGSYLVYSSNEGQTLECPGNEITEDCSTSSGGSPASVPLCVAEGGVCDSDPDCCAEAPYCYDSVCHVDPPPPPEPVQIFGYVDLQGRSDDSGATVTATGAAGNYSSDPIGSWGRYMLELLPGIYTLKAECDLYLWAQGEFTLSEGTILPNVKLFGGDTNMDGVIDIIDADFIGNHYGASWGDANYSVNADINADRTINIFDLVLMGGNFTSTAPTGWN